MTSPVSALSTLARSMDALLSSLLDIRYNENVAKNIKQSLLLQVSLLDTVPSDLLDKDLSLASKSFSILGRVGEKLEDKLPDGRTVQGVIAETVARQAKSWGLYEFKPSADPTVFSARLASNEWARKIDVFLSSRFENVALDALSTPQKCAAFLQSLYWKGWGLGVSQPLENSSGWAWWVANASRASILHLAPHAKEYHYDKQGRPVLAYARHSPVVQALVENGCDPLDPALPLPRRLKNFYYLWQGAFGRENLAQDKDRALFIYAHNRVAQWTPREKLRLRAHAARIASTPAEPGKYQLTPLQKKEQWDHFTRIVPDTGHAFGALTRQGYWTLEGLDARLRLSSRPSGPARMRALPLPHDNPVERAWLYLDQLRATDAPRTLKVPAKVSSKLVKEALLEISRSPQLKVDALRTIVQYWRSFWQGDRVLTTQEQAGLVMRYFLNGYTQLGSSKDSYLLSMKPGVSFFMRHQDHFSLAERTQLALLMLASPHADALSSHRANALVEIAAQGLHQNAIEDAPIFPDLSTALEVAMEKHVALRSAYEAGRISAATPASVSRPRARI